MAFGSQLIKVAMGLVLLASIASFPLESQAEDLRYWQGHVQSLQEIVAIEPGFANHRLRLARAQSMMGNTPAVLEQTRAALQLGAHPSRVNVVLGDHYRRIQMYDRALAAYDAAMRAAPRMIAGWLGTWMALLEISANPRERSDLNPGELRQLASRLSSHGFTFPVSRLDGSGHGQADDPRSAMEKVALGYRNVRGQDFRRALDAFEEALEYEPNTAQAFRGIAIASARLQRPDRALSAYQLFLYLADPDDPEIPSIRKIISDYYRTQGSGR